MTDRVIRTYYEVHDGDRCFFFISLEQARKHVPNPNLIRLAHVDEPAEA